MRAYAGLMAVLLGLAGCGGGGGSVASPGAATSSGQSQGGASAATVYTLDLPYQRPQFIDKESLGLTLSGLVDSRCKLGQQCITAGALTAKLSVSLPGFAAETVELQLDSGPAAKPATVRDYAISLLRVSPTPAREGEPLAHYVLTVQVERLKAGGSGT